MTIGPARAPRTALALRQALGVCVLAAVAYAGAPLRTAAQVEVIDRVLAVAGGEVITLSDVRAARELGRVDVGYAAEPVRAVLSQLTDRALVLAEVDRFAPPEPTVAALDEALDSVIARYASAGAFDALLTRLGIDRAYVRELLREDLRIRAYLDQRFTADTPAEQRRLVEDWVAGLRRRSDVIDLYETGVSGRTPGTARPGGR